jgi:1-acyl-sn-glycerol-3-phosphate acyltransferase
VSESPADAARGLVLRIASEVAHEIHGPRWGVGASPLTMGSSLERDLGLDSLGRGELLARLERHFAVALPESALVNAETPEDLWQALAEAGAAVAAAGAVDQASRPGSALAAPAADEDGGAEPAPDTTRTLVEVLAWHAERHPRRRHLLFYAGDGSALELNYGELQRRARGTAAGLRAAGVERGQAVALMLPSGHDYFVAFCGVLLAGAVPVPLYPPARRSQIEDHLRRQAGILDTAQAVALITFGEAMTAARLLRAQVPGLARVTTVADLEKEAGAVDAASAGSGPGGDDAPAGAGAGEEIALLQFTSGSTGQPKGVVLTHANLLANLRAIGRAIEIGPRDVVVSWLPLYHDMGLIGAWMASLYFGMPLVLMSPLTFLARPARWLQALSHHRGTLSAAPNFAYELCAHKVTDEELAGVDLSSWRFALNGAEPVSPEVLGRFTARFRGYGFEPRAMAPVYGLAECSLALAFPPLGRGPVIDVVDRRRFERSGLAVSVVAVPAAESDTPEAPRTLSAHDGSGAPDAAAGWDGPGQGDAAAGSPAVLRFVGCGMPLPGHQVRIVDAAGNEVGERVEGRLEFRGPSATSGYFRDPAATRRLRHGDWLDSGDRAYTVGREVFLTGRDKDIIIRGGRNLYPHELEEAVGAVAGIRKGCVAVFGVADRRRGTERLVVLAETRERQEPARARLRAAVEERALALLGEPVDEVVLAPPHSVPKTSSGKVRRAAGRELYLSGRIGRGSAALGVQMARLAASGVAVQIGRAARAAWAPLYSAYVWLVYLVVVLPLWVAVATVPGVRRRRSLVRGAARLMLRAAGLPFAVSGLDHLAAARAARAVRAVRAAAPSPGGRPVGCLLAVNHASYLDAAALPALLPPDLAWVAKRELEDRWVTRVMMRRLDALLVERFDRAQSAAETPRAAAALAGGESLIIFPEGTFTREPGLRPFRLGAFVAAAQAGAPIVPAILRGTRSALRDGGVIFRRGPLALDILAPIWPDGDDWAAALRLRDRVRAAMLAAGSEPDLAPAPR